MPFHTKYLKFIGIALLFLASYFAGHFAAMRFSPKDTEPDTLTPVNLDSAAASSAIAPAADNWGGRLGEMRFPEVVTLLSPVTLSRPILTK